TVVSRETAGGATAVVTVGAIRAGTVANIIPDEAELLLSVRTYDPRVRERALAAIDRIVRGEAATSGAPREPEITAMNAYPAVVNDADAVTRTRVALAGVVTDARVVDPGPVTGSEDVGVFATAAGAPLVYWLLGGADPAAFAGATTFEDLAAVAAELPSNHSPLFAPVVTPTLDVGVAALAAAAKSWLPAS
ncbi:peptidase dimerization domain-containing protein, partial [Actinosynnema sp. NPDC023658]|uniref:peptidase dimerization domain-containing protein n=1 Tax=Actinosynnema sp. NPDC023658 TaxID=3155465 RepID=UPI0033DCB296